MDSDPPENNQRQISLVLQQDPAPMPQQPRQPRNLQGLLRFAMEATKAEDAPGESSIAPMDDERRRFLEDALRNMTVDVAQVLRNSIKTLTDTEVIHSIQMDEPLPESVQMAFNNLQDFIDDIDIANDFSKMGGFAMFPVCYGAESAAVRTAASVVLGELCQNNPFCQERALEFGLVNVLLKLIEIEQGTPLTKCLFALSCAVREYEPASREIIAQGGCATLAKLLDSAAPAACARAAFLARRLASVYPEARAEFIQQNLVKTIAQKVRAGRDESTEHLLSLLAALVESEDPAVLRQCREPSLDLRGALKRHLEHPDLVDDTFLEEKEYCADLLSVCSDVSCRNGGSNDDGADR